MGHAIVLGVWWSGTHVIVCILLVAMFVDWSVKLRMGVLEEQDGVVLGVSWPLLAYLPVIVVHQMNTSGSSCHTPVADIISGVWMDILYLMDVFHVV